jgi:nicotinate-nucleotide pyrophosphorylase (carboxylating)
MNWNSQYIVDLVRRGLEEDVGSGDATALATVPVDARGKARIIAREEMICAGLPLAELVFRTLDPKMQITLHVADGERAAKESELLHLDGNARAILTGERTALNFLGRLSGVATVTHMFVEQLAGTKAKIRDTRKTTPGLRLIEKYAVKMGGGTNHRMGLYDAILLKENHIALAGGVKEALDKARAYASSMTTPRSISAYEAVGNYREESQASSLPVQIEVRDERELREALSAGAEAVLLDNMTPAEAAACVRIVREVRRDCVVEISGGITLENVRAYAETGADFLSSGALTHSARAGNLSLLVDSIGET